jgi:alpha-L-arabinofuranosidase
VEGFSTNWTTHQCEMISRGTKAKASLNILFEGSGSLDIDMVSLFPKDTWKERKKGLRAELVPIDQLEPYVQDALDLIEFANGPANIGIFIG